MCSCKGSDPEISRYYINKTRCTRCNQLGKMPDCRLSRLVVTKSLNKGAEYALGKGGLQNETSDVELAARMKKRDAGSAPQMGDRVPYVIITGAKGAANFEKAEDSIFVLDTNMPIDCKWYLTNRRCTSVDSPLFREHQYLSGQSLGRLQK